MPRLAGKVAIITGSGTGIGRGAALLCSQEGAAVALLARRSAPIDETAGEIARNGGRASAIPADIRSEESVRAAVKRTLGLFGRIDILVNNAGIPGASALIHQTTDQTWEEIIDVNLTGCFRMMRAVIPHFLEQGRGVIVNVSSINGLVGTSANAAYSVAKSGLIALSRCSALEYARSGIRCNCVCPGVIDTAMTEDILFDRQSHVRTIAHIPQRRVGQPEDIAAAILYLASDESAYATGAVFVVDGGYTAC